MNIGIIGSRTFDDYDKLESIILKFISVDKIDNVVSGGANGADNLAERFAFKHSIPTIIHRAKWQELGKKAGFMRNVDIIKDSDFIFVFWDGESKGTEHSIHLCTEHKKPYMVTFFEQGNYNNLEEFLT